LPRHQSGFEYRFTFFLKGNRLLYYGNARHYLQKHFRYRSLISIGIDCFACKLQVQQSNWVMKVFITKAIPELGIRMIENAGHEVTVYPPDLELTQEKLIEACQKQDAVLLAAFGTIDRHFLEACKHLKVIALYSVGYDSVDIKAATELKIPVGNTPGVLSRATADIAFLLMMAVSRKAFYNYQKILDGNWKAFEPVEDLGLELYGKTLGIFGLGKIGFEMARLCQGAFNMKVIYHNRKSNEEYAGPLNAKYVSFDEMLAQSDVLSLHANLSESTKGLMDRNAFSKMKPNAIFINTARGAMHNEHDLKEALENGVIWGAGLDVTNPEPMDKDNPLLRMPNVCVLPHIGSATAETRNEMARLAANNIIAGLKGEHLPTIINSEVYE